MPMRLYLCHKVLSAGKIERLEPEEGGLRAHLVDGGSAFLPAEFVDKRGPSVGGYLVEYEDGYLSFSPAKAFERGYRLIDGDAPVGGLDFGAAIQALKHGAKVARTGWNGKGMWLALSGAIEGRRIEHTQFWSKHNADHARAQGGSTVVLPCITMKTADGSILMGWLASQTDMLAEDWMIMN